MPAVQISRNPKSKVMSRARAPRLSAQQRDPSSPSLGYQAMMNRWHLMNHTLGGTETITSNRDFVGRQIACSGVVGSKPWLAILSV